MEVEMSYSALAAENAALRAEKASYRREYEVLHCGYEALRTENEALRKELRAPALYTALTREVEELRRDIADLKADLVMADQVNQALHGKIQSMSKSYDGLRAEYAHDERPYNQTVVVPGEAEEPE